MTGGEYLALLERSPKLAHEKLFGEYYNYVRTIAFNRLRSTGTTEDIEECISDIFAQIFFTFGEKYSNGDMKGFVGIVAKRMSIDYYRKLVRKAGKTFSMDEDGVPEISAELDLVKESENSEIRHILMDSIRELGEPDSTILIQKYYYNKRSHQIGTLLSMNPSTVRMRCKRAAEKLRRVLENRGIKEGMI